MTRFGGVLKKVGDGLDLPGPARSRILLEMAGDLEDLYQHHLEHGCDEAEAARRAEEAFFVSEDALKHLTRIHRSSGPLADRLTGQVHSLWAKVLLGLWLLAVFAIALRVAGQESLFRMMSPFAWPTLGLAAVAFLFSVWKLVDLQRRADPRRLRAGLGTLLFVAIMSLALPLCGLLHHLRWFAFQTWNEAPEAVFRMAGPWMLAVSSLMILGLLTSILAALLWFVLNGLVNRIEARQLDALLAA